jgi:hypothetical protein
MLHRGRLWKEVAIYAHAIYMLDDVDAERGVFLLQYSAPNTLFLW